MTAPTLILPDRSHAIASDLRAAIGAEKVKDDSSTLTAYAVDASMYRLVPKAVVLVETEEDIAATLRRPAPVSVALVSLCHVLIDTNEFAYID